MYSQDRQAFKHRLQAGFSPGHLVFFRRHAIHASGSLCRFFPALVLVPLQAGSVSSAFSLARDDDGVKPGEGDDVSSACVNGIEGGTDEVSCVCVQPSTEAGAVQTSEEAPSPEWLSCASPAEGNSKSIDVGVGRSNVRTGSETWVSSSRWISGFFPKARPSDGSSRVDPVTLVASLWLRIHSLPNLWHLAQGLSWSHRARNLAHETQANFGRTLLRGSGIGEAPRCLQRDRWLRKTSLPLN